MTDIVNKKDAKRLRLELLYGHYLSLLTYEGSLLSNRFGHAIATQTIFFGAYFVTTTSEFLHDDIKHVAQFLLSACAIAALVISALILARTSVSATSWRASLLLIEEDDDFWYPNDRTEFQDLDILSSRDRASKRVGTEQQRAEKGITSTRFKLLTRMGKLVRDPADFYAIYFPIFFCLVWLGFMLMALSHIAFPVFMQTTSAITGCENPATKPTSLPTPTVKLGH